MVFNPLKNNVEAPMPQEIKQYQDFSMANSFEFYNSYFETLDVLPHIKEFDINSTIVNERSLLHTACIKNNINIVKDFIAKNSNFFLLRDYSGNTPLDLACLNNHINIVQLLLKTNVVDINAKNEKGNTPLHIVSSRNNSFITKLLINYGADSDIQNNSGETPLHLACRNNHLEVVKDLLSYNVNTSLKNRKNKTALDFAIENKNKDIVEFFKINKNYNTLNKSLVDSKSPQSTKKNKM